MIDYVKIYNSLRKKIRTSCITIGAGLVLHSLSFTAFGTTSVWEGFNPITTDTINLSMLGNGIEKQAYTGNAPSAFSITQDWAGEPCGNIVLTTLDGYSGIQLAPGVLFVIYDSILTGDGTFYNIKTAPNTANYIVKSNEWNSKGVMNNIPIKTPYCFDIRTKVYDEYLKQNIPYTVKGTIKTGIYVAPNTLPSTITTPTFHVVKLNKGSSIVQVKLSSSNMTVDVNPTNCTVSMPTTVPFGNITNKSDPIIVSQMISLQCFSYSDINVSYQVTSKSGTATDSTIPINNIASGNKVGDIRGFLNSSGTDDAGCLDTGSSMKMNGTSQNLFLGLPPNTTQQIPVSWALCPSLSAEPGPASATLSFDITW